MPMTRRRLFAVSGAGLAGGGAAAVLSACGTEEEEPSAERDVELLGPALEIEEKIRNAAGTRPLELEADIAALVRLIHDEASAAVERLAELLVSLGVGEAPGAGYELPAAETPVEAIALGLNDAIAVYHDAAGALSTPDLNSTVLELVAVDAAQLAALRGVLGEEQAREPFVTGLDEPSLVAEEQA